MPRRGPSYSEREAREAIAASRSFAETMRRLGMCPGGGACQVLRKWVAIWRISTDHFDQAAVRREALARPPKPLSEILVKASTYSRGHLKRRLFAAGLKERSCELCGQGDLWQGRPMSLILDHINGVRNDHRLENLQIVCPNCAATLDTHCGRNPGGPMRPRDCARCGEKFEPTNRRQRYCSRKCGYRNSAGELRPERPQTRRVGRPAYEQLRAEIGAMGYVAVGRRYGVSDNAIRKWVRRYEREAEAAA